MAKDKVKPQEDASAAAWEAAKRTWTAGDLIGGAKHLERAAELGHGEAVAKLAHFIASGVTQRADWDRSVDLLQQAAELGWEPARRELHLLARGKGHTPQAMRGNVDIRDWIQPRPTEVVAPAPRIRRIPSFMSAEECAWIIERGAPRLKPAEVYEDQKIGSKVVDQRSNSSAAFDLLEVDVVLVLLHARMSNSIGLPSHLFEPTSLLHYLPGQQFVAHHDFLDTDKPGLAEDIKHRGQRVATFLTYLNDDYEGGETHFPRIGLRFKGRMGDALVFANVDPSGAPDQLTLHAGLPPTTGEKWLLSQWIRDRASL